MFKCAFFSESKVKALFKLLDYFLGFLYNDFHMRMSWMMKFKLLILCFYLTFVFFAARCNSSGSDKNTIHQVYIEYKNAILNNDTEKLSKLLSSKNRKLLLGNLNESMLKMIKEMLPDGTLLVSAAADREISSDRFLCKIR